MTTSIVNPSHAQLVLAQAADKVTANDHASLLDWTARLSNVAYILAAVLFIMALAGLSKPETARRGNALGMTGMGIAIVVAIFQALVHSTTDSEAPVSYTHLTLPTTLLV